MRPGERDGMRTERRRRGGRSKERMKAEDGKHNPSRLLCLNSRCWSPRPNHSSPDAGPFPGPLRLMFTDGPPRFYLFLLFACIFRWTSVAIQQLRRRIRGRPPLTNQHILCVFNQSYHPVFLARTYSSLCLRGVIYPLWQFCRELTLTVFKCQM